MLFRSELIAEALSSNIPSLTAGFIRQLPMRDLLKTVTAVESAASILTERGREDLLALAYLGGYVAPEREVVLLDPNDATTAIPAPENQNVPSWAINGEIGQLGSKTPAPLLGDIRLRSVYGESYTLGSSSFDKEEVVFDTPKDADVKAIFNGYVSYVGSSIVEIRSYDQRLVMRYRGVTPTSGTLVGKVYTQGETIGMTSGFALGISTRVDGVSRNLLQLYSESTSKSWFNVWEKKNPGQTAKLTLGVGDSNYHITSDELPKDSPSSYTNPDMYGVDPSTLATGD